MTLFSKSLRVDFTCEKPPPWEPFFLGSAPNGTFFYKLFGDPETAGIFFPPKRAITLHLVLPGWKDGLGGCVRGIVPFPGGVPPPKNALVKPPLLCTHNGFTRGGGEPTVFPLRRPHLRFFQPRRFPLVNEPFFLFLQPSGRLFALRFWTVIFLPLFTPPLGSFLTLYFNCYSLPSFSFRGRGR